MKKAFKTLLLGVFACMFLLLFGGIAFRETVTNILNPLSRVSLVVDGESTQKIVDNTVQPDGWHVLEASESSGFITGPLVANIGELCVFRLNNPGERADWAVVPPAMCYVDSSGSSLAFASNVPAKYTIVAAIVEDGVPKILQHICEYGISPEPSPTPSPHPTPNPSPTPPPTIILGEWIKQNIPEAGRGQCAALAACYEAAADAIEKNAIRTPDAAFSTLRTATQTKIKPEIWGTFLDQLSGKVTDKLENGDVKKLGTIFIEIADGLKAVVDVGDVPDESPQLSEVKPSAETLKLPPTAPATNRSSPPVICSDPTGQACKPTSTPAPTPFLQYRRLR
jgi:hypothetical protein